MGGLFALSMVGCETTARGPWRRRVRSSASFRRRGRPAVFLNGVAVATGTSVFAGDRVSTGPGGGALIELAHGGFVQLDEKTDPFSSTCATARACSSRALGPVPFVSSPRRLCAGRAWHAGITRSDIKLGSDGESFVITVADGSFTLTRPSSGPCEPESRPPWWQVGSPW